VDQLCFEAALFRANVVGRNQVRHPVGTSLVISSEASSGVQGGRCLNVHLVNPSSVSFGTAVITPRWQYVLLAATPRSLLAIPQLVDETLFQDRSRTNHPGDAIGIGIHTRECLCAAMKLARWRASARVRDLLAESTARFSQTKRTNSAEPMRL